MPCNQNAPEFRRAELKYGDQLAILHVDQQESISAVVDFANKYALESPFLMDPSGAIGRQYRIQSTPTVFFVDPDGVIQDIRAGVINLRWIETNLNSSL